MRPSWLSGRAQYILVVSGNNSDACKFHRKRTRETGHTDGKIARDLHRELPWPSYIPHQAQRVMSLMPVKR